MKRLFTALLLCALLCALAAPALADVAYTPRDDFIEKHWNECSYENRWYWTNGAEGYVLAHPTPDSAAATPLPNGMKYYISNVYKDEWGVLEYDPDTLENTLWNGSVSGWVRMSEMVADYDNDAFEHDHRAEIVGESAELLLEWDKTAYGYKYPGSGIVVDDFSRQYYRDPFYLSPLFTDPAGRTWGFVGYNYGRHDCWICIDDPYNDALAPDENCVKIAIRGAAEPAPTATPAPTPEPTAAPTPAPTPEPSKAPDPTAAPSPAPTETPKPADTPKPTENAGKTIELTPPADDATLQQAAKANRGSGPYILAGGAAVVVVAAAVLVAALRRRKK